MPVFTSSQPTENQQPRQQQQPPSRSPIRAFKSFPPSSRSPSSAGPAKAWLLLLRPRLEEGGWPWSLTVSQDKQVVYWLGLLGAWLVLTALFVIFWLQVGSWETDKGGIDWSDVTPSPNDWLGSLNSNSVQWWLMMIRRSQIRQSCAINFSSSALFVYTQRFFYQMDFIARDLGWSGKICEVVMWPGGHSSSPKSSPPCPERSTIKLRHY